MNLTRRQAVALKRSTATINIWYGSIRSSKTHGSLWHFIRFMAERAAGTTSREGAVLVVAVSTNTAWRNIFQPLLSHPEFESVAPHLRYRRNAPTGKLFGVEFNVVGGATEASWISIQGMTVAYALGDEAVAWVKTFWDMLMSRLSLPTSTMLVTCNPGTSNHYLKKLIDSDDPDVHVEKFLLEDNPTIDPKVMTRLRRMYSGLFYRRMILAEWVAAEGAIYQAWDPQSMTVPARTLLTPDQPGPGVKLVEAVSLGIDYGTTHPSAGHLLCLGDDGRMYISHEWSPNPGERRLTDKQLADSLQDFLGMLGEVGLTPRFIYADPAAASFREELKQRGIRTTRADNDVRNGIATVDAALTNGDLLIADGASGLIDEIGGYRWDNKAAARGVDAPIKENDDHVDALRYAVYSSRHLWRRRLHNA